jgi:hypothetical protein
MAMDLYEKQPLKATGVSGSDIKRLERLKLKASQDGE